MLIKLLDEIKSSGTIQVSLLAHKLGISEAMTLAAIDELKRRGLLKQVSLTCGSQCGGCPMTGSCTSQNDSARLWQVTQKPNEIFPFAK